MSNNWDEDRASDGEPRCRICERPTNGELCADCAWHTEQEPSDE